MIDQAIQALGAFHVFASIVCFIAYAFDKRASRTGRRRTAEQTLLLLGLAGGWPGGVVAQHWLRHKTSKRSFQLKFWLTVALNIAVVAGIIMATRM